MATLEQAARDALANCTHWMDGAVIIRLDDGSYDACPPAYLTDISFSLRGHIDVELYSVDDLFDIIGPDTDYPSNITYSDLSLDDQEWALQQVITAIS